MSRSRSSRAGRTDAAHLKRARAVLARAFRDYPLVDALFPAGRRRDRALSWYVGYALRYCIRHGEVYTTPSGDGVAALLRADQRFTYPRILAAGLPLGPFRMGLTAFRRLMENDNYLGLIRDRCAVPGSWYIWIMGVDPAVQGTGVGGALLRGILADADAAAAPCYLETHRSETVGFYQAHGFRLVCEGRVPAGDLPFWALSRPAAPETSAPHFLRPRSTTGMERQC